MSLQRIVLLAGLAAALCPALAQPAVGRDAADRTGCATVVVGLFRGYVNTIDVTLPTGTDPQVAGRCITRLQQHSDWQFDTPRLSTEGGVSASANAVGLHAARFDDLSQVAAILLALDTRERVIIIFLDVDAGVDGEADFENQYISGQWRQVRGLRVYDITVKQQGFETIADLISTGQAEPVRTNAPDTTGTPWELLVLASLLVGAVAYFATRAMVLAKQAAGLTHRRRR
jgi:hypothetical protein